MRHFAYFTSVTAQLGRSCSRKCARRLRTHGDLQSTTYFSRARYRAVNRSFWGARSETTRRHRKLGLQGSSAFVSFVISGRVEQGVCALRVFSRFLPRIRDTFCSFGIDRRLETDGGLSAAIQAEDAEDCVRRPELVAAKRGISPRFVFVSARKVRLDGGPVQTGKAGGEV